MISGFYLTIEGIGSLFFFADQEMIFQVGRVIRIVIGFFLIAVIAPKMEN
jgi:hypothetical protein